MIYFKQQTIAFRNIITNEYYPNSFNIDFSEIYNFFNDLIKLTFLIWWKPLHNIFIFSRTAVFCENISDYNFSKIF